MPEIKCGCVILNYNDVTTTIALIKGIADYKLIDHIVVVDNCSTDNSFFELSKINNPKVKVIKTNYNGGYGYGNNFGVEYCKNYLKSKFVLICNPDVIFSEELLRRELMLIKQNSMVGVVAPIQLDKNGNQIKSVAWRVPTYFDYTFTDFKFFHKKINMNYDAHYFQNKEWAYVDCVPGSWLLINSELFCKVGGYDEDMFLYCEETTLGTKMKARNILCILDLKGTYIHNHSVSINKTYSKELSRYKLLVNSRLIYIKKYLARNIFQVALSWNVYQACILKKTVKSILRRKK